MFDLSLVNRRYFTIKLTAEDEEGKAHVLSLDVEPARLKTLKKLISISKTAGPEAIDELCEAIQKLLSKNKSGKKVPEEYITALDFDQLQAILTAYFEWLGGEKEKNPN